VNGWVFWELAGTAGVSIDYYIRLEQGRESNPSPAVLDSLADALILDEEERTHLRALARRAARHRHPDPEPVRPGIHQLLETIRPCPAYVLNLQISEGQRMSCGSVRRGRTVRRIVR
jgi:transcriptional regulator with XRE-family HTH domain